MAKLTLAEAKNLLTEMVERSEELDLCEEGTDFVNKVREKLGIKILYDETIRLDVVVYTEGLGATEEEIFDSENWSVMFKNKVVKPVNTETNVTEY